MMFKWVKARSDKRRAAGYTDVSKIGFYNTAAWQRLRASHLSRHPLCVACKRQGLLTGADVVDHIVPLTIDNYAKQGLNPANLQSLCYAHHKLKTNRERSGSKYNSRNLARGQELKNKYEDFEL
mgnify:CR=1 FL=1